jgi:hypothetical protein
MNAHERQFVEALLVLHWLRGRLRMRRVETTTFRSGLPSNRGRSTERSSRTASRSARGAFENDRSGLGAAQGALRNAGSGYVYGFKCDRIRRTPTQPPDPRPQHSRTEAHWCLTPPRRTVIRRVSLTCQTPMRATFRADGSGCIAEHSPRRAMRLAARRHAASSLRLGGRLVSPTRQRRVVGKFGLR